MIDLAGYIEPTKDELSVDERTEKMFVNNELIIGIDDWTMQQELDSMIEELGIKAPNFIEHLGEYQFKFEGKKSLRELKDIKDEILSYYEFVTGVCITYYNEETKDKKFERIY